MRSVIPTAFVLFAAAASLLPACASSGSGTGEQQLVRSPRHVEGDAELAGGFRILDPSFREEGGVRRAEFELENATDGELEVLYHVEWYDARAVRLAILPQLWQPLALAAAARVRVRAVAPAAEAASFRLLFQRPGALTN